MAVQLFPPIIQQEIQAIQAAVATLQQRWSNTIPLNIDSVASIYDCYPFLFLPAFQPINPPHVRSLALAGRLFASAIFLSDRVLDGAPPKASEPHRTLQVLALYHEAYSVLQTLFPGNAAFWPLFQRYLADHTAACASEQQWVNEQQPWSTWDETTALATARGKNGIARATIAGLATLSERMHLLDVFTASIDDYNIATQLLDDLSDWKDDYRRGMPSLLLHRLLSNQATGPTLTPADDASLTTLAQSLYYDGHASTILQQALSALDNAELQRDTYPELGWWQITARSRQRCEALWRDIDQITTTNRQRRTHMPALTLQMPPIQTPIEQLAAASLRVVLQHWQRGFGELRHIMIFPRELGFQAGRDHHYGDVFQRALIADTLCDANGWLDGQLTPVIDHELDYLKVKRRHSGIGGWSYFPELSELPPDADDLAQIMQVLLRQGRHNDVYSLCELPLHTLLSDNTYPDGSFETWIIPAHQRTDEQNRQALFTATAWGYGPDCDVMANMLYALWLYDSQRFAATVQAGLNYIQLQQRADGAWSSTWYDGLFYGTYVNLRLLAATGCHTAALQQGHTFLLRQQHPDGGWGNSAQSDALSTALALLGLAAAHAAGQRTEQSSINQGIACLQRTQETPGVWASTPLIRMEVGRATGNVQQLLTYGSRTISSAFVLKALLAWQQTRDTACVADPSINLNEMQTS